MCRSIDQLILTTHSPGFQLSFFCNVHELHMYTYMDIMILSLLMSYIASGNFTVLAALLEAGCPANSPDIHGVYPLHYAVNESREPDPTGERERGRERERERECVTYL